MSDIFISYAREDKPKAQVLAEVLEEQGWTLWWDPNVRIGSKFDQIIKAELDAAKCVIVLWSRASALSDWVKDEAAEAARRSILVPVLIEDTEIPFGFGFRQLQTAWLIDWDGSTSDPEFSRLVKDISVLIAKAPTKKLIAIRTRRAKSLFSSIVVGIQKAMSLTVARPWLIAGGVLAVIMALALGLNFIKKQNPRPLATNESVAEVHPTTPAKISEAQDSKVVLRLYQQMDEGERAVFIDDRSKRISKTIAKREYHIPPNSRMVIKRFIDRYVARIGTGSKQLWNDDLNLVFKRATHYAPYINFVFSQYEVPPIIGLYIPMIESEYHECLTSPFGAKGLFQFIPKTGTRYGLDPSDFCKLERSTPAAAMYIKDNLKRFSADPMDVALSILSFNHGELTVQQYIDSVAVLNDKESEERFWALVSEAPVLDPPDKVAVFGDTRATYVQTFFAAAIIGEFPESFGLDMKPLSTCDKATN